jgi:tetratricopeptide (TPR) repeat protein
MLFYIRKIFQLLGIAVLWPAFLAHAADCSITQPHTPTEEQSALIHGDFGRAETLYLQKIALQPKDSELTAGLVRTLLAEQKVDKAESTVKAALAATPQSVELLTALAEVQYRQGFPWDEEKTLSAALQADSCYPRLHLVFARYYWFNSYNASAVREVKLAHQLDPNDYDIQSRWIHALPLKQRIDELKKYLAAYDLDADRLHGTQHELALLEDRLANQTGFCKLASPVTSTEIPLTPLLTNANRIREWSLDVFFNDHKSHLLVDTTIHGLYVSRSMAEHAGLKLIAKYETNSASGNDKQVRYTA